MVSTRPPIYNSSRPSSSIWGPFRVHQLQLVSPSPSCSIAFLVLWKSLSTYFFFRFLWFSLWDSPRRQSLQFSRFSFFINYLAVMSSGLDLVICLYLKILEKFVPLILQKGFRFVPIPFGSIVQFQSLAQFPVDHLPHSVVSSLILFLC